MDIYLATGQCWYVYKYIYTHTYVWIGGNIGLMWSKGKMTMGYSDKGRHWTKTGGTQAEDMTLTEDDISWDVWNVGWDITLKKEEEGLFQQETIAFIS